MAKPVALILLNWNTPVHTANCILSLKEYCDASLFDIIVADNGSADGSLALLRQQFPDLIYIDNKENLGFAEGNNRGLTYSVENGYTYSLVMNTDTLVNDDLVSGLVSHLDHHPEAALVQPAIYWMHDKNKIWNGKGGFNRLLGVTTSDQTVPLSGERYQKAKWATGCCMLIRNAALVKTGGFNKLFFLYYEDVDLSYRLRGEGYEVHYLPSCKMYHEAGVSAKIEKSEGFLSPIIHYYVSRNLIWFLRGYGSKWLYPINLICNVSYYLALLVYFKLRGRNEKARLLIKGLKEGLFMAKSLIWSQNNTRIN